MVMFTHSMCKTLDARLPRVFHAVSMLMLLLVLAGDATAQPGPLLTVEHDWTVQIAGARFGLCQTRFGLTAPVYRQTTVYLGSRRLLSTRMRSEILLPILLFGAVACSVVGRKFLRALYTPANIEA